MGELPGGLVLRGLRPADLAQTADLLARRGDESDALDLRLVVEDPDAGYEHVAVVVDGDRVVSTATLLNETVHLAGVPIPAGQVELVATEREYEGRGLVRALMAWAHGRSRERGQVAQVMIGIPYFYRLFGYGYAMPMHRWRPLVGTPPQVDDVLVRRATAADIPAMDALQRAHQQGADLWMPHATECWRWLVAREGSHQLVATRGETVVGTARLVPPPEGCAVGEFAAADPDAALALLGHCHQAVAGAGAGAGAVAASGAGELTVQERPDTLAGGAIEPFLAAPSEVSPKHEWYYARIEDLGALLRTLAPVLAARFPGDEPEELLISSFGSHVRFTVGPTGITGLTSGGADQAPVFKGGSGVPPDALPGLVFGPYGALGLEERLPDCHLGRRRELMAALFPPVRCDLLTYYLPC